MTTYVNLDNLRHAGTSGGQDSLDVIAADLGLVTDAALDQGGGGIGGDLAGDEDLAVGADGLGLLIVSRLVFHLMVVSCFVRMRGSGWGPWRDVRKGRQLLER